MISSLRHLNTVLFKNSHYLLSNCSTNAVYLSLKSYNGIDWRNVLYTQNNKYEEYSEAIIANNRFKNNNLIIKLIKWHPDYEGQFHNHNGHHCYYKVLDGKICETINTNDDNDILKHRIYAPNSIGYISDEIGEHKIKNLLSDKHSYSLHVYFKNN